jgi:hypothetical protein
MEWPLLDKESLRKLLREFTIGKKKLSPLRVANDFQAWIYHHQGDIDDFVTQEGISRDQLLAVLESLIQATANHAGLQHDSWKQVRQ